jgi:competence protein ComEA
MERRIALMVLLAALLLPNGLRRAAAGTVPPRRCDPSPQGRPPRHWLGCSADAGPTRDLADGERLVLGRPLDLNAAGPDGLAWVPGLSRRLAAAIAEDRAARGPFTSIDELLRVDGIGPRRLERARGSLIVSVP